MTADASPTLIRLLAEVPVAAGAETIHTLLRGDEWRLERIVSRGQASPEDFWYDQPAPEWVALLRGTARLAFAAGGDLALAAGDSVLIPARCRHRVADCSTDAVWLALHFKAGAPPSPSE